MTEVRKAKTRAVLTQDQKAHLLARIEVATGYFARRKLCEKLTPKETAKAIEAAKKAFQAQQAKEAAIISRAVKELKTAEAKVTERVLFAKTHDEALAAVVELEREYGV